MVNWTKYILYARKSTTSEDRQTQSIDDQIRLMNDKAKELWLEVITVLKESASAKNPDNRPEFVKMVQMIESGKADGILCYHANRIARNSIDGGKIQHMLQIWEIKSILTLEKEYVPEDNALLYSIETSMASQFSIDLSKIVTRGMVSKCEKGWYPGCLPQGYQHDRNTLTVVSDIERLSILRELFRLMLRWCYTVTEVVKLANEKYAFRFLRRDKSYSKLSVSTFHGMLRNIFYAGHFYFRGQLYKWNHEAIITLEEHQKLLDIISNEYKPRLKDQPFPFTSMIRCGECWCFITAENKYKKQKNWDVHKHTYYHCTGKKHPCTQQKNYLKERDIIEMIDDTLNKITINERFHSWAIQVLKETHKDQMNFKKSTLERLKKQDTETRNKRDSLIELLLDKVISDEDYRIRNEKYQMESFKIRQKMEEYNINEDMWYDKIVKVFDFFRSVRDAFNAGDALTKKEIFSALGQNYTIMDKKLSLELHEWFMPLIDSQDHEDNKKPRLEPEPDQSGTGESGGNSELNSVWCTRQGSNLRPSVSKTGTLPAELRVHISWQQADYRQVTISCKIFWIFTKRPYTDEVR